MNKLITILILVLLILSASAIGSGTGENDGWTIEKYLADTAKIENINLTTDQRIELLDSKVNAALLGIGKTHQEISEYLSADKEGKILVDKINHETKNGIIFLQTIAITILTCRIIWDRKK